MHKSKFIPLFILSLFCLGEAKHITYDGVKIYLPLKRRPIYTNPDSLEIQGTTVLRKGPAYDTINYDIFIISFSSNFPKKDIGVVSQKRIIKKNGKKVLVTINNLPEILDKDISQRDIEEWVIYGKKIIGKKQFVSFWNSLKDSGLVKVSLNKNFQTTDFQTIQGHRIYKSTFLISSSIYQFIYIITPKNDISIYQNKLLIKKAYPKLELVPFLGQKDKLVRVLPDDEQEKAKALIEIKENATFHKLINKHEEMFWEFPPK